MQNLKPEMTSDLKIHNMQHLRADVSKYRPVVYKSEKLKNQKKIHRVALVDLDSIIIDLGK